MAIYALHGVAPTLPADGEYWIAPTAAVMGNVRLGREASIWFGVSARADHAEISIGDRSNVQENTVLHVDPGFPVKIGADTTIGHAAIIHGCTIGDGVIVGMGSVIMNGAVIGDGSIVGGGAVVTENANFPPNSLIVGTPAKAIRTLDGEKAKNLKSAAASYVANWRNMKTSLVPIQES